jgi:hypothetical protein
MRQSRRIFRPRCKPWLAPFGLRASKRTFLADTGFAGSVALNSRLLQCRAGKDLISRVLGNANPGCYNQRHCYIARIRGDHPGVAIPLERSVFVACFPSTHLINLSQGHRFMSIHLSVVPVVSLAAGILILVMPKLLNYIIALYLILIGIFGIFGTRMFHL